MTYYLDLSYHESSDGIMRGAHIYVKNYTRDPDEEISVSCRCASIVELEYHVDKLIAELEVIRQKGRRIFAASDRRRGLRQFEILPLED